MKALAAVLVLTSALAGCVTAPPPPQPTYADAFKGIYNQSAATVPADRPVTIQQPVAIILNDNIETYFQFVKRTNEHWAGIVPSSLTNTVVNADTNPSFLSGRVLDVLKKRYPGAQQVKDFNEAVRLKKRAVLLVDVLPKLMEPYGDRTTRFDITVYFFDANMNPVSKIAGHGEQYRPIASMDVGVQVSVDAALKELEAKMDKLVR